MAPLTSRAVVLIGFMGAGKTTAAREIAALLDTDAIDADQLLEARLGMPIAKYFDRQGEGAFRAHEEDVVGTLLDHTSEGVIALGGGALTNERVRASLFRHRVVYLDAEPETAWLRARRDAGPERPLAQDQEAFHALHREREPVYASAADVIVPADDGLAAREWWWAADALGAAPSGTRMLWARAATGSYPVYVGRGLLKERFFPWARPRRFLVTDGAVARRYSGALEPFAGRVAIMPGEQSKTVAHAEIVWTELAQAGMTREDMIVALGGGVVGDLAGFCAATYQRGVPVVQVPTTLVSQADSAYGGKTGVDLPEAKNYVGAYHQPAGVIADPSALDTLPPEELAAGYAEVVKTALIAGGRLWDRVRAGAVADDATILSCARTKLAVVSQDERDGGRRQVLNLGHTVGHAIETVTGYARYRHGEAVGLGLLAALRLSGLDDLREEVKDLLRGHGLPVVLDDDVDPDAVVLATSKDKKRVGEAPVPFVLVHEPGDVTPGHAVPAADIAGAVRELGV